MKRAVTGNETLCKHEAEANGKAASLMERSMNQTKRQKDIAAHMKTKRLMAWAGEMNGIRSRAERIAPSEGSRNP